MNTRPRACASVKPSATICATICSAIPQPAEPAPKKVMIWSLSCLPAARDAAIKLPTETAAVP